MRKKLERLNDFRKVRKQMKKYKPEKLIAIKSRERTESI